MHRAGGNFTYKFMVTLQQPIHSGFGAASTAAQVIEGINLSGKVAMVTGGYAGIGLETTRALHSAGATVVVPARDMQKAAAALNGLERVEIVPMDLLDPAAIDAFAQHFLSSGRPLHILVNNAGIMAGPLQRDGRGYELQFATNHLGHFQLTVRLLPALRSAGGARVVAVASWGHRRTPVVFDDVNFYHRQYEPLLAYGQSKTANVLFAVALDEREQQHDIRAFSLHPGGMVTDAVKRYITDEQLRQAGMLDAGGKPVIDPSRSMKSLEQGAATSIWCATSPRLGGMGGLYCQDADVAKLVPPGIEPASQPLGVMPFAVDPAAARQLWELSEELTGLK